MLVEGERWDALCHGFKTGVKTYKNKRQEQKAATECDKITQRLVTAEGKELEDLIKRIVKKGYVLKNGEVTDPVKVVKTAHQEMWEHGRIKTA